MASGQDPLVGGRAKISALQGLEVKVSDVAPGGNQISEDGKRWQELLALADRLAADLWKMPGRREDRLRHLRSSFESSPKATLALLGFLDPDYTKAFVPQLVYLATLQRNIQTVCELLGRLRYSDAKSLIPAAVWVQLEKADTEHDPESFHLLAGLLIYLGLDKALTELAQRAQRSEDTNIREVGDAYSRNESSR